jgi:hypothetical protein
MQNRIDRLPKHLQEAAREALNNSFTPLPAPHPPVPAAPVSFSPPPWVREGKTYFHWLINGLSPSALEELALSTTFWDLAPQERLELMGRLKWTLGELFDRRAARARERHEQLLRRRGARRS